MISVADPQRLFSARRGEISAAIERVIGSGLYILGPEVDRFESDFSQWCGSNHAVGVGNATDSLELALQACGVGYGDEVITVSHTAVATVCAILRSGATPVFVDVNPETANIDASLLCRDILTTNTKALVCVHLYGRPADVVELKKFCDTFNLILIEDCSQAHGAEIENRMVGTFGEIGCFSCYPTKNLSAIGDAGVMITQSESRFEYMKAARQYGWRRRYVSDDIGRNTRLDELQAAVLNVNLRHLSDDNARRISIANRYNEAFQSAKFLRTFKDPSSIKSVFHLYVVRVQGRSRFMEHLASRGVGSAIHYPVPVHQQPAYVNKGRVPSPLTHTETLADEVCSLPLHPFMTEAEINQVIAAVMDFND